MQSSSFLSASQPTTSTVPWVFPEFVQGSSHLESAPSIDPRLHDATKFLDLRLPPNTLQVVAPGQASGRMPALFNGPASQPMRTAKTFAATKRTAARSDSQPRMWKTGGASAYARGVSAAQPVSRLAEVPQFQPPPVKARARHAACATKSNVSQQPVITMPSGGEQSASQHTSNQISAVPTAAPQVEVTPFPAQTGSLGAAVPSAASWRAGVETTSTPASKPLSWETDTGAEISEHCGLDDLPLELIDKVLPRLRAFLKTSESSTSTDARKANTTDIQAPNTSSRLELQTPCSSGMEESELLANTQLLAESLSSMQPTPSPPAEEPTLESLSGVHQSSARLLSPQELDVLLWGQGSAVAEPTMEDASAVMEFLRYLDHSQEIEAGREFLMAPLTCDDAERTTSFGEDMDMGAFANLDYGQVFDGWEGWAEFRCADGM